MNFCEWMRYNGLADSSVSKYSGAINGVLSDWAIESGITNSSIQSITDRKLFELVSQKIMRLPIYLDRNERGHNMYSSALVKYAQYLEERFNNEIESDIEEIFFNLTISASEKINLIKSRIGQGIFRERLIAYWGCCSASGFKETNLLVASHIKPWRSSNNIERLDIFNGLLLTPNLDKVFDRGFITFSTDGDIKISSQLLNPESFGINRKSKITLSARHEHYMSFHRESIFRDS